MKMLIFLLFLSVDSNAFSLSTYLVPNAVDKIADAPLEPSNDLGEQPTQDTDDSTVQPNKY